MGERVSFRCQQRSGEVFLMPSLGPHHPLNQIAHDWGAYVSSGRIDPDGWPGISMVATLYDIRNPPHSSIPPLRGGPSQKVKRFDACVYRMIGTQSGKKHVEVLVRFYVLRKGKSGREVRPALDAVQLLLETSESSQRSA